MEKLKEVTGQKNIHHLETSKTNILSKIHDDHFKNVTSRESTRFSFDLTRWPSFWYQVTQFKLDLEIIKTNIFSNTYDDYLKNVTSGVLSFLLIWPGDLVFDPSWPSFKLDLEIDKTNILSKIHDDCLNKSPRCFLASLESIGFWV